MQTPQGLGSQRLNRLSLATLLVGVYGALVTNPLFAVYYTLGLVMVVGGAYGLWRLAMAAEDWRARP